MLRGLLLLATAGLPLIAAGKGKRGKRGGKKRTGSASELLTVQRVGSDSMCAGGKTYSVVEGAEIIVNGQEAEMYQIKVGMQVSVTCNGVLEYGKTSKDTVYKTNRIVARTANKLGKGKGKK